MLNVAFLTLLWHSSDALWEENIEFVLKKIVITTSVAFQNLPCLEKKKL